MSSFVNVVSVDSTLNLGVNARLDSFLASESIVTKSDIVRRGFTYLINQCGLGERAALQSLAAKINVISIKAVKFYLKPAKESVEQPSRGPGRPPIIPNIAFDQLKVWLEEEYQSARYHTMDDIVNRLLSDSTSEDIDASTLCLKRCWISLCQVYPSRTWSTTLNHNSN